MVDQMMINLAGKNALGKQELTILDMLQTNNFERPMYYAITVSPDQSSTWTLLRTDRSRLPGRSEKCQQSSQHRQNVRQRDEQIQMGRRRQARRLHRRKCNAHVQELPHDAVQQVGRSIGERRQERQALEVLDKCMQVLPPENVPLDYTALSTGELYYVLGQKEKAAEIFTGIAIT